MDNASRARALIEQAKRERATVSTLEEAHALQTKIEQARTYTEKARLDTLVSAYERQQGGASVGTGLRKDSARLVISGAEAFPQFKAALGETTNSQGGYLVPPEFLQALFLATRRQGNALRALGWMALHQVNSNVVNIPRASGAAAVGIVAENAAKPSADMAFTQLAVNVFTLAGIIKMSRQLFDDAVPEAIGIALQELGTLLGNLEETKIISGTGSGEPRGILNTTGLAIAPQTASDTVAGAVATAAAQRDVLDRIIEAASAVQSAYFAPPTGVLMHPRRLAWLPKGKDSANNYLLNPAGMFRAPDLSAMADVVTSQSEGTVEKPDSLFGLPFATSTNIPTTANYGITGASDQDVILVGNWRELHAFVRQDVTWDVSREAGTAFEQNQIWGRLEERIGFSVERAPQAFAVVHGKGLAATNV